jgi:hypothetical protein
MSKEGPSHRIYKSPRRLVINNFFAGIAWGVGSVIGATLVVALIIFILTQLKEIPFLGNIIQIILQEISRQTRG